MRRHDDLLRGMQVQKAMYGRERQFMLRRFDVQVQTVYGQMWQRRRLLCEWQVPRFHLRGLWIGVLWDGQQWLQAILQTTRQNMLDLMDETKCQCCIRGRVQDTGHLQMQWKGIVCQRRRTVDVCMDRRWTVGLLVHGHTAGVEQVCG